MKENNNNARQSKDLSIIIVAYNSNEEIANCFRSINQFNPIGKQLEVVVVDNKPNTGLKELLTKQICNFEWLYIPNEANTGFGGGNNIGARACHAPYVFFLNPDTILIADVITPTIEWLRADENRVVGYRLIDKEGRPNYSYSYFPEYVYIFSFLHLFDRLSFNWFANHVKVINRLVWPWGAAFALSKQAFDQAGEFDENIFLCNEEPDLMRRIPNRHVFISSLPIIHLEGHGRTVPVSRYAAYLRSANYYLKKHQVRSFRLFWWWTEAKLRFKKMTNLHNDQNLWTAFQQFKAENL